MGQVGRLLLIAAVFAAAGVGRAADAPATATRPTTGTKPAPNPLAPAYIDVEKAPADYKLQGEYAAKEDGSGTGVQIVSLREQNGTVTVFRAVLFGGGLPGAGWDGKTREEYKGKLVDGKADFGSATADGTTMTGKLKDHDLDLKHITRVSPTMGAAAPAGAVVLFDGKDATAFTGPKVDERGLLAALGPKGGEMTFGKYGDVTLHAEFIVPFMPAAGGQDRGNSGIYFQNRYEVQILDSFGLVSKDDDCGGIYKNAAPKVNMCFPPLTWQTYDIEFTAAKWDGTGKKIKNAMLTVKQNGVLIQDNVEVKGPTFGQNQKEDPSPGPLYLQAHNNPVFYRNVWLVEKK